MAKKKAVPAASPTIATALAGAGDAPINNLSTTVTQGFTDGGPNPHYCVGCDKHDVQFCTKDGATTLRCKICGREVNAENEGEAQSLRDYNRNVLTVEA